MIDELPRGGVIEGRASEGFGPVVDAFVDNFRERGEVGAGVTVYRGGATGRRPLGRDRRRAHRSAWTATTPAVVFSCTKGVLAIAAYLLVQDGTLDLDAPVARYWPEFGAQRQGRRSRCAGCCPTGPACSSLDRPLSARRDARVGPGHRAPSRRQAPLWPPGTAYAYHTHHVRLARRRGHPPGER